MSAGLRILLVDDNPDDRELVTRALRNDSPAVEVVAVGEPPDFRRALQDGGFDLVITDYQLRWTTGLDVLREVKACAPLCPVILFTATGSEEVAVTAMKEGLDDYVLKSPKHFVRLSGAVRAAVERSRRRHHERELEARLRRIYEARMFGILFWDAEGTITQANDSLLEMLGHTRAELLARGTRWTSLTAPEYAGLDEHVLRELRLGVVVAPIEKECLRRDGTRVPVLFGASSLDDSSAKGVAFVIDLTHRKEVEEKLRRTEELLRQAQKLEAVGRLAGGIAHDFNNLLTVIQGYTSLVLDELPTTDPRHGYVDEVQKAAERATALTRQLLAFSRRQVLHPQVLDLGQVLVEIERMLRRLIGEHLEYSTAVQPGLWPVQADRGQMEQVILNLALNARDAMPLGGHLRVALGNVGLEGEGGAASGLPAGAYVRITVSDTGTGMDAATQARLFEPFFTTKSEGRGTGLGLATVHGIVRQSGGDVRVESQLGLGSTFSVYLPRAPLDAPASAEPPAPFASGALTGQETVLVVEDEGEVRGVVLQVLRGAGYRVLEARTPEEALSLCKRPGQLDLLVTDLVMPGMGGSSLAAEISRFRPETRVLFISGHADDIVRQQGLTEGMHLLPKPFKAETLVRTVRSVLDGPA